MVSPTQAAEARYRSEAKMTDSCVIGTEQRGALDETSGKYPTEINAVYVGKCEYVTANTAVHAITPQGQSLVEQSAVLKIPVDAPGSKEVTKGMVALVALGSNDATTVRVEVEAPHKQTFATARRFPVKETN